MLKVVLVIDCEKFISLNQVNPRWNLWERFKGRINRTIRNIRYNSQGINIVYQALKETDFPATLMIVRSEFPNLDKTRVAKNIEIGYHTKNHLPLTLVGDSTLNEEVENILKVKSFSAPMWMIEDKKDPNRVFNTLKKEGYTHTVYRGINEGVKHWHYNTVSPIKIKQGIKCVHVSNWFEGNSKRKQMLKIKREIISHLGEDKIYLITSHDFTHKNKKNMLEVVRFLRGLEKDRKIEIKKLSEIR